MEIVVFILIVVAVVVAIRVWMGRVSLSADDADGSLGISQPSPLFASNSSSWIVDETIQAGGDLISTGADDQGSDNSTGAQDCSPDSGSANSDADCPCPADSTSYDSGGCSVDSSSDSSSFDSGSFDSSSGSFESGNSN